MFAINLKPNQQGSFDFGYIDQSKYKGGLTFVPALSDETFWKLTGSGGESSFRISTLKSSRAKTSYYQTVTVGGTPFHRSFGAIVDSGTTLLTLPGDLAFDYYYNVKGATLDSNTNMWSFPCNANLPTLSVNIAGKEFPVDSKSPIQSHAARSSVIADVPLPGRLISLNKASKEGYCMGGLQPAQGELLAPLITSKPYRLTRSQI